MHTSIERRTATTRMPVTMSVELAHDGWDETYEADAVNVSGTGIGVRGPVLPDVGQRMRCRFTLAELGAELGSDLSGTCETEGEVVWASDGGDAGEFGIRFDTLEPQIGEALARWVSTLEAPPITASEVTPTAARRHVRVQLDGVASPIEAEVSVSDGACVRVEQALPFLLLGTHATVDTHGQPSMRRVLRSVELKIEGSVPRLVLELEPEVLAAPSERGDEGPSTVADESLSALLASASIGEAEAPDSLLDAPAPKIVARAKRSREDDSPRAVKLERDALAELGVQPEEELAPEEESPMVLRLREVSAKVKPTLEKLSASMKAAWASALATGGPRLVSLGAWLKKAAIAARDSIASKAPQIMARLRREPIKRRTTAAPPELTARASRAAKRAEAAPEIETKARPKVPLRLVLIGGLVAVALFFGVRAFTGPTEDGPLVHEPTLELSADVAERAIEPAIESPPMEASTVVAEAPAEVPAPVLPGTLAASSSEVGRLAAPTFPRVTEGSEATVSDAPEETLPTPSGSTSFGAAEVPHGRATTLTMSLPITSIEGEATDSGFTVNLPGVNSLSRAAPIAAANPSVERAAILNSGDHAVLTVRFVAGRNPAYRVEARGSDLVITIGR
jgi:hypothetical protein